MSAIKSIQTIAVYVADLERSKRFYGDLLGLTQLDLPDRVAYRIGGARLLLHPTDPGEGARHSRLELHLGVDDLDGFVTRLAERATPVLQEPVDQPWGEREAIVLDPDGYPIFLVHQPAAEQPEQPAAEAGAPRDQAATNGISSATGSRLGADLQVNCGGDVDLVFDASVPAGQIRSPHGVWELGPGGHVTINTDEEDLEVQVNPDVDLNLQINAPDATIRDVDRPLNADINVGDLTINGRFDHGESRLHCNVGDISLRLDPGSDVRVRVSPHARWQVYTDLTIAGRGEWIMGNGTALLEIQGNFGEVHIEQG